jgi:hypothetical protein
MKITFRNIHKEEAEQFRELRLKGLLNDPGAFSSSYEEVVHQSAEYYKERIGDTEDNYILGAYDENNRLVSNTSAKRLYESLGFQTFGIEKNALRINDEFHDDALMTLHIEAASR